MLIDKYKYIIKKHKFIAYRFLISNKDDVKIINEQLWKEHKKARHIIYAYILNNGQDAGMHNDKEPSGVGALPILNLMKMKKLTNEIIFVVRYWGGSKLGASLLLRSYLKPVKEILNKN